MVEEAYIAYPNLNRDILCSIATTASSQVLVKTIFVRSSCRITDGSENALDRSELVQLFVHVRVLNPIYVREQPVDLAQCLTSLLCIKRLLKFFSQADYLACIEQASLYLAKALSAPVHHLNDLTQWWKDHAHEFPALYCLFQIIMLIQPSPAATERRDGARILSQGRGYPATVGSCDGGVSSIVSSCPCFF